MAECYIVGFKRKMGGPKRVLLILPLNNGYQKVILWMRFL
jgi:hypothetical protein